MITLTLTPLEFDVLTRLFAFGGYVATCESPKECHERLVEEQATWRHVNPEVSAAEGTLNGKLYAGEKQNGKMSPAALASLRASLITAWPDLESEVGP